MDSKKGVITLASSVSKYQQMAALMCQSYKRWNKDIPIAVVTDKKTELLDCFDYIIESKELTRTANDKIELFKLSPFQETIFIESDIIVYKSFNELWEKLSGCSDVTAFGRVLPINSNDGWYTYNNLGDLRDSVFYVQDLHGGIIYFRKGEICNRVYDTWKQVMSEYPKYKFKGFRNPSDEPVFALAMAANNCKVVSIEDHIFCWLRRSTKLHADYFGGELSYNMDNRTTRNGILLHFGTSRTILPIYQIESRKVKYFRDNGKRWSMLYGILVSIKSYLLSGYFCVVNLPKIIRKRKEL